MTTKKFNNKSIKNHKGQMIQLSYKSKVSENIQTGVITASTKYHVMFNINNAGIEIPIKYSDIIEIGKPEKT